MSGVRVTIDSSLYNKIVAEKKRLQKIEAKKNGSRKKIITLIVASRRLGRSLN